MSDNPHCDLPLFFFLFMPYVSPVWAYPCMWSIEVGRPEMRDVMWRNRRDGQPAL